MDTQAQWFQAATVSAVMLAFALAELAAGKLFPAEATREDNRLDLVAVFILPGVTGAVLLASSSLSRWLAPGWEGALGHWSWWQMLPLLLVADDLTQYLWHRLSHTSLMWPLHRAHHSAAYMSVRIVYRNNALYYALMPGLWLSGLLLHLGFGWVYVFYSIVKMTVIIGAHAAIRWDEALYRRRWLHPLAWVIERTVSTPATHFAHHALVQDDGVGHYTGNYGNLLFVWDVLFGTAHFSRRYPAAYGLEDDLRHGQEHWLTQITYPLRHSTRQDTVLGSTLHGPHRPPA